MGGGGGDGGCLSGMTGRLVEFECAGAGCRAGDDSRGGVVRIVRGW